ncbi:hypothetical protein [Chitinivorax sp. B]|uniref:hypothetical protein n=1 Tax=Chitinivorax sp. B TaxID=2502235 RepID=UPI00148574C5|nr:hypothetical protein [Chitinivorax sp. B]
MNNADRNQENRWDRYFLNCTAVTILLGLLTYWFITDGPSWHCSIGCAPVVMMAIMPVFFSGLATILCAWCVVLSKGRHRLVAVLVAIPSTAGCIILLVEMSGWFTAW